MTPLSIIAELLDRHLATSTVRPETFIRDLSAAGFVIVPREPTQSMIMQGRDSSVDDAYCIYLTMIAAWEKANV